MNVLVYGAGNWIAISAARYLHKAGHNAILADTGNYFRGFYSRYCDKRYIFRDPDRDKGGFCSDLYDCIKREDVGLLLPTSDKALFDLIGIGENIFENVKVPVPLGHEKITYVTNKSNIPFICDRAGIGVVPTRLIGDDFNGVDLKDIPPPYVIKPVYGLSGEGVIVVENLEHLKERLEGIKSGGLGDRYLLQSFISGEVYGAGGIFEGKDLKHFYSYRYMRRYPLPGGQPTICLVDFRENIKDAISKVLSSLQWVGFCHMDFIIDEKTRIPYLTDINPIHWYSVPYSLSEEVNCLNHYLDERKGKNKGTDSPKYYATISIVRELQRIAGGAFWREKAPKDPGYWRCLRSLKRSDFCWDPFPVILAPLLRLLRSA